MFANEIRLVVQCNVKGSYFFRRYFCACQIPNFCKLNKSVSVVEPLMYDSQDIAKFEFPILSLCLHFLKKERSFSVSESLEVPGSVFCNEELSFLSYKT